MGRSLDFESPFRFAGLHPAGYAALTWVSLFVLITVVGLYGDTPVHLVADLRYLFGGHRITGAQTGMSLVIDLVAAFGIPTLGAAVMTRRLRRRCRPDVPAPLAVSPETEAWLRRGDDDLDD